MNDCTQDTQLAAVSNQAHRTRSCLQDHAQVGPVVHVPSSHQVSPNCLTRLKGVRAHLEVCMLRVGGRADGSSQILLGLLQVD